MLIVGGPGWSQSVGDGITAFAERNQIPLAAAFRWQDAVDNASPSYAGYLGLGGSRDLRKHVTADADLIVALGPRLDDPTTDGYQLDAAAGHTVLVSQAPGDLGGPPAPAPALAIHASLESVAAALRDVGLPESADRKTWRARLRGVQERFHAPAGARPHARHRGRLRAPARGAARRTRSSPTGPATTRSGCSGSSSSAGSAPSSPPGTGRWGTGCPAGLAAAALHPDRTVVTVAGDGCFLMSGNELATAVQFGLNVIVIVVNNGMLGTIRMHQERAFPGHVIAHRAPQPRLRRLRGLVRRPRPAGASGRRSSRPPSRAPARTRPGPDRAPHRPRAAQPGPGG